MIGVHVVQKGGRAFAVSCEGQNEVTIGRVMGNDVVLADVHVSSRHSRIVLRDGKYIIVDLKSRNGTYVNGKRISSPQVLKDGDKIYIGDFALTLAPSARMDGALRSGGTPRWMHPVDIEETVLVGQPTRVPAVQAVTPAVAPPPPPSDIDDEVTPPVGTSRWPSPPAPPTVARPSVTRPSVTRPIATSPTSAARTTAVAAASARSGRRTIIDDDVALGLAPVAAAPLRVGGITVGERVRDDGLLVTRRGTASGRDARVVQLSDGMRDDPEAQAMLRDATKLVSLFSSPRMPRFLASEADLLATSPPPGVTTLAHVVEQRGAIDAHVAVYIALEIARALADLHEVQSDDGTPLALVHRTLTPKHIELARDGTVQLEGFVHCRFDTPWREVRTAPGILKGDIPCMAPEQARGLPVDARCDLWSLGVVLYTMTSGANPFVGADPFDTLELVRNAQPPPLAAATELQPVLDALLAPDRSARAQTAREAIALLERAALSLPPASRLDVERLVR